MRFESPYVLFLLLAVPVPFIIRRWRKSTGSVRFSSTVMIAEIAKSWRQRVSWMPSALRMLALAAVVVALARPQKGLTRVVNFSEGVAMEVVIDRSGSMEAPMPFRGKNMTRLQVVKEVFREFALGNGDDLKGRPHDLIGVIAFARYADTVCPLTLGHDAIPHVLKGIELAKRRSEGGTAIGDALALAAARLRTAEKELAAQKDTKVGYTIKSKVIIMLTDGQQEGPVKRQPMEAAELAKTWGIKIYTIGVGKAGMQRVGFFGRTRGVDEKTLKAVAAHTGGRYFSAESADALHSIYREIDRLETSEITSESFVDYEERFPLVALVALGLFLVEVALSQTIFRRLT